MTRGQNEQKAKEIANTYPLGICYITANIAAMEMAEWKDEQLKEQRRIIRKHWQEWAEEQIAEEKQKLIENACKWLKEQEEFIGISFQEDFIERFKKEMEK